VVLRGRTVDAVVDVDEVAKAVKDRTIRVREVSPNGDPPGKAVRTDPIPGPSRRRSRRQRPRSTETTPAARARGVVGVANGARGLKAVT